MNPLVASILAGTGLGLVQLLAALPWLILLDSRTAKAQLRKPGAWLTALLVVVVTGALIAFFTRLIQDPGRLLLWGRIYGAVLQAQLTIDFFILFFPVVLLVWPHGGAVALAAFREAIRQPMYWLIIALALGMMIVSPFLPYFTFGEDHKVVRELGHDITMLAAVMFSVLAASMSISEEIEGRTAITVMSKPISRRHFLLGKFLGILMAALLMTGMLGWVFNSVMWYKLWFDGELQDNPIWLEMARQQWTGLGSPLNFALGGMLWFSYTLTALPGFIFGFCQVMVLLAIAVALATRLPMVVNMVTCLVIFFLGHLTHILVQVSSTRYALVNFMARFFDNVLPGLEYFDLGPIIVRDVPPDPTRFAYYIGSVCLYAVLYSIIALLFGLILFEDRDLA